MTLSEILNLTVAGIGLTMSSIAIGISITTFKKQIRMSLFEKRYDIYYACELICGLCSIGEPDAIIAVLDNRNIKCDDPAVGATQFLFDKETYALITEIFGKWNLMRDYHDVIDSNPDVKSEYEHLKNWFALKKGCLDGIFRKYLDLRETK